MKFSDEVQSYNQIDLISDCVKDMLCEMKSIDSLERCIVKSLTKSDVLKNLSIDGSLNDVYEELFDCVCALEALLANDIDCGNRF